MANIVLCGEAWGEAEDALKHPFVGPSGMELISMLSDAGAIRLSEPDKHNIDQFWYAYRNRSVVSAAEFTRRVWAAHPEFTLRNVFNLRPARNDISTLCGNKKSDQSGLPPLKSGHYVRGEYLTHIRKLQEDLAMERPNIVVALGATAAWALLRNSSISKIRGAIAESTLVRPLKVLPTYHPAGVLRQWDLRHVTVIDLEKAFRESSFPEIVRPERTVYVEPSLSDLEWFWTEHIQPAQIIAPDIETASGQITCIGFAVSRGVALVVPFVDSRRGNSSYWQSPEEEKQAWEFVRRVLNHPAPKVFQNGLYDIHFLWRGYGITVNNALHDTMLLHHALQPESPKGLGFLGSVYTNEASWKIMRERTKTLKREE